MRIISDNSYWGEKIARIKNPVVRKYLPHFLLGMVIIAMVFTVYKLWYSGDNPAQLTMRYSDNYVSFRYPKSWIKIKPEEAGYKPGDSKAFKVYSDGLRKTFLVYVVKTNNLKAVIDYKKLEAEIRTNYRSLYPGTKIISINPCKIGSNDGLKIILEYKQKNNIFTKAQYVTSSDQYIYWLTVTSTTDKAKLDQELVGQILDTVEFK